MRLRAARLSRLAGPLVLAVALAAPAIVATSATAAAGGNPGQAGVAAAAGGNGAAAAGASGGTLRAWGQGTDGQLGNGKQTNVQAAPVRVRLGQGVTVTSLRGGCDHTLALTANGHLLAWGLNSSEQLGDGSRTSTDTPVRVKLPQGTKIKSVRAGCYYSLALTTKGHVLAWGSNYYGELGNGSTRRRTRPVRVKFPAGTKIKAISAGCDHNLALTTKGHVLAWGDDNAGQLGIGSHNVETRPVRVRFPGNAKMKIIAAGCYHNLAYSTGRQLYGWGINDWGQVGDGSTTERDTPVTVSLAGPIKASRLTRSGPAPRVVSLFGGINHSLALLSNGVVLAWGNNTFGQLGDGTGENSDVPVQVATPGGTQVTAIAAGCYNGLALTSTGAVLAWGDNSVGDLGNDKPGFSNVPVAVTFAAGLQVTGIGGGSCASTLFAIVHKA
jgi:alpha-tubulin suppressor-like RCC1 family protein